MSKPVQTSSRYVLIDGYLRVEAVRRLARDTVEATVWLLSESEALIEHHHLSSATRSALEEGWLCARLRDQGLELEEVARRLCRSKSWVSRRLGLVGVLNATVQSRVRAGTGSFRHFACSLLRPVQITCIDQNLYEADNICLDRILERAGEERCNTPRAHAVMVEEVSTEDGKRLLSL